MLGVKNNSTTDRSCRCFLLELPCELRDIIFQYAQAYDGGIVVDINTAEQLMHVSGRGRHGQIITSTVTNPLRLVCHQLREETRGIIFKVNHDVAIYGISFATPSSYTLQLFAQQIGVAAVASLRKVAVHGSPNVDIARIGELAWKGVIDYLAGFTKFCAGYPHVLVVVRFRTVKNITNRTWLNTSIALKEIVRGVQIQDIPGYNRQFNNQQAQMWLRPHVFEFKNLPASLGFSVLDALPVEAIIQQVREGMDYVLPVARGLWEDGI